MIAKFRYIAICIGGLALAFIDPKLAFFYAITGLLLLIYVQYRVMCNSPNKEFFRTKSDFKNLNEEFKAQIYIGLYMVISSLIGLFINIGVSLYAL
ncbi:MAG: hypothetical protein GY931_20135 [Maribacter sp.]|nr:hypothetical protein [Maribacter sp.]